MILIVDDHVDTGTALVRLLKQQGCDATAVTTAAAALEVLTRVRPQVIVLDIHMPDVDGMSVLRQVRANAAVADVPVVLFTGDITYEAMRQATSLGATDFIVKGTVAWDKLCERIMKYVTRSP